MEEARRARGGEWPRRSPTAGTALAVAALAVAGAVAVTQMTGVGAYVASGFDGVGSTAARDACGISLDEGGFH